MAGSSAELRHSGTEQFIFHKAAAGYGEVGVYITQPIRTSDSGTFSDVF